jgi:hypothetical protein
MKKNILLLVCFISLFHVSNAQNAINSYWETNGQVNATAKLNGKLFVGGEFTYVGPSSGCFGAFNTASNQITFNNTKITGQITATVSDNAGNIYLAGDFSINGSQRKSLAKFSSSMVYDASFNFTFDGQLVKMAVNNNNLFVAGQFSMVNNQMRNGIAAIDLSANTLTTFAPNPDGQINTLHSANGVLYVGGNFNVLSGSPRTSFGAYDGSRNLLPLNLHLVGSVSAIAVSDSLLFVAGSFDSIAGTERTNLASFNLLTGNLRSWRADVVGQVNEMAFNQSNLYLAGNFYQVGIQIRSNLAACNLYTAAVVSSFNPGVDSEIKSLKIKNGNLYLGGSFSSIGTNQKPYLAAITISDGTLTGNLPKTNGEVNNLLWAGDVLISTGSFSSYGGVNANNFIALDYETGTPVASSMEIDGPIYDMEIIGSDLMVAGNFNNINNTSRVGVAIVDTALFLPNSWNPNCDAAVNDVLILGNTIYLAGEFTHLGTDERNYLALVNSTSGAMTTWNPNPDGPVKKLLLNQTQLYALGTFNLIGSSARKNIASFDLSNNGSLRSWSINADSTITDMAPNGNAILIGGLFTQIGTSQRNYLAAIDTSTSANILSWSPQLSGEVYSLDQNAGFVYVGGNFNTNIATGFTCFQTSNSTEVNFPVKLESGSVRKMLHQGNRLYISGAFALNETGKENFAAIQLNVETPTIQASNLTLVQNTPNSLSFRYTKGNGTNSIILVKEGAAVDTIPGDGLGYNANLQFGSGESLGSSFVLYTGTDTTFTVTGLNPNTTYHFAVYAYNGFGANSHYLISNPARSSQTTIAGYTPPTLAASNIQFSNITLNQMTIKWTNGNGSARYVVMAENSAIDKIPADSVSLNANSTFSSGDDLGNNNFIVFSGAQDSVIVVGLKHSTTYHVKIFEYNGNGIYTRVLSNGTSASANTLTPAAEPTNSATALAISNVTANSMQLNWTSGNGTGRIVVASMGAPVSTLPLDGETYFTDNTFNGSSSFLSNNERVVYVGTGTQVTVSGLDPSTVYHFAVLEFNGSGLTTNYQSNGFPTANRQTLTNLNFPTIPSKNITFTTINQDSFEFSWTVGNGQNRLVAMRKDIAVSEFPANGLTYLANNEFGAGDSLLEGSRIVYAGSGNSLLVYNLEPNTVYQIAIFEYNNTDLGPLYLKDSFAIANNKTLNPVGIQKVKGTGSIMVYPNPSKDGNLTISFSKALKENAKITIYDITGRAISESYLSIENNNKYSLNLSNLTTGEYLVKVISGEDYFVSKISIQ